jgi:hypothetical protein
MGSDDQNAQLEAKPAAGDPISPRSVRIEVAVGELRQLFNAMDPSPFRERDLDPRAESFIAEWANEAPRDAPLTLLVRLHRGAGLPDEAATLRDAIHEFYLERARVTRRRLRELFRRGRVSLLIGLAALLILLGLSDLVSRVTAGWRIGPALTESLLIGGWVAMWRPLEIFLYDWWPRRAQALLYDRLGRMPVRIIYEDDTESEAWRTDWPAVQPGK